MSIQPYNENCQTALASLSADVSRYIHSLLNDLTIKHSDAHANLTPSQLALLCAYWPQEKKRKIVIIDDSFQAAQSFFGAVQGWDEFLDGRHKWHFLESELTAQERDGDVVTDLSTSYHELFAPATHTSNFVIRASTVEAPIPDRSSYLNNIITLTCGEQRQLRTLITSLVKTGYIRSKASIEHGTFRVRGDAVDICHPLVSGFVTVTFIGTIIESITHVVQPRSKGLKSVKIPPLSFPKEESSWANMLSSFTVFRPGYLSSIGGSPTVITDSLNHNTVFPLVDQRHKPIHTFPTFIVYTNKDRVGSYASDHNAPSAVLCKSSLADIPISIVGATYQVVSERTLFPADTCSITPITLDRALALISNLEEGKPAVHADHGIGIYEGLQRRTIGGVRKEYLVLRYAEGDSLSVPVEYAHKVTPYIGERSPQIYRLGGTAWLKTKRRANEDAAKFAHEIISIAQVRDAAIRSPLLIDRSLEHRLEESFPFTLTRDQEHALYDVFSDFAQEKPADRLVVGDVGFGKTEIAIRAARHAVLNQKQVAVLAPTTLLVQQHFDTFQTRLPDIRTSVHMLSRFSSTQERLKTVSAIEHGSASIVIGTHALLGPSVRWKNLGLVIIDEEQRFGVKQKEHLKNVRSTADVISLSATPIPRTLSMALSGLRQMSVISSPPEGRKSVKTFVRRLSSNLIIEAASRELGRKGQVIVVAPKIRYLHAIKETVASLVPSARIAIAHGRLPDKTLSSIVHQFDCGEIDILVSSSIVENGLDLPSVNTLIVWHAPHFGLADLYQLRGRIGRRKQQGYAYFLYNQDTLTPIQRKRLAALTQASRLGSGWDIALRDLEIRGAGNLLGAEQSGSVNAVGVQMYLDMVRRLTEPHERVPDVRADIQLALTAIIPIHYIEDADDRTKWYVRLARSRTVQQVHENVREMKNVFGPLPIEVQNLILIILLRHLAQNIGIKKISSTTIHPPGDEQYARLRITSSDTKLTLNALAEMGNWNVKKENELTLDMDAITPDVVQKIIHACEKNLKPKS